MKNDKQKIKEVYEQAATLREFLANFFHIFTVPFLTSHGDNFIFSIPLDLEINMLPEQIQDRCENILEDLRWNETWLYYKNGRLHCIRFTD